MVSIYLGKRYEVLTKIGAGGMADVYKGKDHMLNRYVAIKVLKKEFREDETFVKKFRSEAQAAAGLLNPNIVNVYDVGEDRGLYYMVMELVDGITLKEYIDKKGRLSAKEVISIAIQMCNGIEAWVGREIRLDAKDSRVMVMCGMSAAFSALFGTPLTAVCFSMEVVSVGVMYYAALVPCVVASLTALQVAQGFGLHQSPGYEIGRVLELGPLSMVQAAALGLLCALVSILFCKVLHTAPKLYAKYFPNPLLRAAVGGALVLALTLLVGSQDYNGAGDGVIRRMLAGETIPEAFLMKILFTALTLGAGFRGGEIVPVLFTGAAFGTTVGPLLGLPHGFGGALGMAAVFCGATNCPMTALMLAFELFGGESLTLYAVCCGVAYMLSGYYGLYSEQKIVYSKFRTEWIDKKAK